MKKVSVVLLGVAILSVAFSSATTPVLALNGCGPNRHASSVTGKCVWGGENQSWCRRHTGHGFTLEGGHRVCHR
jgi:hypothetical protein